MSEELTLENSELSRDGMEHYENKDPKYPGVTTFRFDPVEPGYSVVETIARTLKHGDSRLFPVNCAICEDIPVYFAKAAVPHQVSPTYICIDCRNDLIKNKERL